MMSGYILLALFVLSSAHTQFSTDHIRSQFLSDDEIREVVDALDDGHSSERLELMNLQETRDIDSTTLNLHSEDRQLNLKLIPSSRLIQEDAMVRYVDGDEETWEPIHPNLKSAFYHGYVDDEDRGAVALAKTETGWTGLLETKESKYILHGVPDSERHLLVKMEAEDLYNGNNDYIEAKREEVYNMTGDESFTREEVYNMTGDESFTREEVFNMTGDESFTRAANIEFELEVGAYTDEDLYYYFSRKYRNARYKIQEILLIILNTMHTYYQKPSMGNRISIVVSGITIMSRNERGLRKHEGGGTYLNLFCEWEATYRNPMGSRHDIGLMFTGLDIYADESGNRNVIGMAPVSRTCKFLTKRSCGLSEGKSFSAALIQTHEIGHNLGMWHDGQGRNRCPEGRFVMGPAISQGVTDWSQCSRNYLAAYLRELDDFGQNCMRYGGRVAAHHQVAGKLPGQRLPTGEQCSLNYGAGWTEDSRMRGFCNALGCRNSRTGQTTYAYYPPLPGTPCGYNSVCYSGQCMGYNQAMNIIRNYRPTNSGGSNRALSINQLCSKYSNGYRTGVDYNWTARNGYRINLSNLCTNLLCYNGRSLIQLDNPAPAGTSCAAGRRCRNYRCQ